MEINHQKLKAKFLTYDDIAGTVEKWEAIDFFNELDIDHSGAHNRCKLCGKRYKTNAGLVRHIWEKHHEAVNDLRFHPEKY